MHHAKSITFRACTLTDTPTIVEFFWSLKEELRLKERSAADAIVPLLFDKGGIIGGFVNDEHDRDKHEGDRLVCAFGYFLGEPARDYANQEIGFIYIAGIAKAYRRARVFTNAIGFLATKLQAFDVSELRCHAGIDDPYTNKLYGRYGEQIATEPNRRGHLCNLYAIHMPNVLALANRFSRTSRFHPAEPATAR